LPVSDRLCQLQPELEGGEEGEDRSAGEPSVYWLHLA
jgi:hypothetical protein